MFALLVLIVLNIGQYHRTMILLVRWMQISEIFFSNCWPNRPSIHYLGKVVSIQNIKVEVESQ